MAAFAPSLYGLHCPKGVRSCCPRIKKHLVSPPCWTCRNLATCAIKYALGVSFDRAHLDKRAVGCSSSSALGRWRQNLGPTLYTACNEASRTRRKRKLVYTPPSGTRTPLRPVILCFAQHYYATASSPIIRLSCSRNGFRPRQHQVILETELLILLEIFFLRREMKHGVVFVHTLF